MKFEMNLKIEKPRYFTVSDITYAQVDAWFGHTTRDLKLDLIYPKLKNKKYPCIVWFCGGGWIRLDKSAHFAYLAKLALEGFAVASVEYRTSNEGAYPMPLEDVKAAIRYIKAHADRYNIDENKIGVAGESAGGYLAAMCALDNDKALDVGNYLDCSSEVQACCAFYPPTDVSTFPYESPLTSAASMESLMLGMNVALNKEKAMKCCPVSYVTPSAPPFMIFTEQTIPPFLFRKVPNCTICLRKTVAMSHWLQLTERNTPTYFLHRKSCGIWWRNFSRINFINRKRLHAVCKKAQNLYKVLSL